mgnify:CR=1 FL=1
MDFPFSFDLAVGQWVFGEIEGVLKIEANEHSDPAGEHADWTVDEILVNAVRVVSRCCAETGQVELTDTHWLHDRVLADVINRYRNSIDKAWAEHMTSRLERAKRGFDVFPGAAL